MGTKEIWPCVRCAESTFRKKIAPKLKKYGYLLFDYKINYKSLGVPNTVVTNYNKNAGVVAYMSGGNLNSSYDRYLCTSIAEFLEAVKALAEARRQFRELTKHYTVEELSKDDRPKSWEEYCQMYPTDNTKTTDMKFAALRKLRLMRDKWVEGSNFNSSVIITVEWNGSIRLRNSEYIGGILSFPSSEMAMDFITAHHDLIKATGNLLCYN